MGKDVVIWKMDVSAEVKKAVDFQWLETFKGFGLELKLNDDILDVLEAESDFTTPAFMVEDAQEIGKETVDAIVAAAGKIDAASKGKKPQVVDKLRQGFEKVVKQLMATQGKKLEKVPDARWKKFVARYKQYKDYKIKAGFNVAIGTLSVAGSAAGIVGSAAPGWRLASWRWCAALPVWSSSFTIWRWTPTRSARILKSDCDTLEERYKSAAKMVAAETTATTVKGILGTDMPFVATLPKAQANYELWDNKVAGVTIAGRRASAGITEAMKRCNTLEAQIKNAENKEARKIYQKIVKARKLLDKSLTSTSDIMAKVRNFEKNGPALKKVLDALEAKNTDFNKVFEKVFPTVVGLSLGARRRRGRRDRGEDHARHRQCRAGHHQRDRSAPARTSSRPGSAEPEARTGRPRRAAPKNGRGMVTAPGDTRTSRTSRAAAGLAGPAAHPQCHPGGDHLQRHHPGAFDLAYGDGRMGLGDLACSTAGARHLHRRAVAEILCPGAELLPLGLEHLRLRRRQPRPLPQTGALKALRALRVIRCAAHPLGGAADAGGGAGAVRGAAGDGRGDRHAGHRLLRLRGDGDADVRRHPDNFYEWFGTLGRSLLFAVPDHDAGKLVDGDRAAGDEGIPLCLGLLRAVHRHHLVLGAEPVHRYPGQHHAERGGGRRPARTSRNCARSPWIRPRF